MCSNRFAITERTLCPDAYSAGAGRTCLVGRQSASAVHTNTFPCHRPKPCHLSPMPPPTLDSLPPELLEHIGWPFSTTIPINLTICIALFALAVPFLGPPSFLLVLLTINKSINHKLSSSHSLLHHIFQLKFDVAAPARRFVRPKRSAESFADELRIRCRLLKRFKYKRNINSPNLCDDFWKAYILLLESDGKNETQLFEYANLYTWLEGWWLEGINHDRPSPSSYPLDSEMTSLGFYLLWRAKPPRIVQ